MFHKEEIGDKSILENEYGIVLAGGGAKGAYQAGAIKALVECGLSGCIQFASGSSIGAINMCLLSQENPKEGVRLWNSIEPLDIIDIDVKLIDGKEGFSSRSGLVDIIRKNIDLERIITGKIQYYAAVSAFHKDNTTPTAQYIHLNQYEPEQIIDILLASSALPLVYEPVDIEGVVYKDGGLTDNLPIRPLYEKGIRHFIILLLSHAKKVPVDKYPDADFIVVRPSVALGDLFEGTLNFSKDEILLREKLGYYDCVRTLKYYNTPISKKSDFEKYMAENAKNDLSIIKTELMYEKSQKNFDKKMNKISSIMERYGIE